MGAHPLRNRRHSSKRMHHGWTAQRVDRVIAAVLTDCAAGPVLIRAEIREPRGTHYLRMCSTDHAALDAWAAVPADAARWLSDYLNANDVPIPED